MESENALKELQGALSEAELKKERIVHANGALQDSLAAAEAKEKHATVRNCLSLKANIFLFFSYFILFYFIFHLFSLLFEK